MGRQTFGKTVLTSKVNATLLQNRIIEYLDLFGVSSAISVPPKTGLFLMKNTWLAVDPLPANLLAATNMLLELMYLVMD